MVGYQFRLAGGLTEFTKQLSFPRMNQILSNLKNVFANLHVSLPVIGAAVLAIIPIWFPKYATQLQTTAAILAGYGIIAAGNTPVSSQTPPKP